MTATAICFPAPVAVAPFDRARRRLATGIAGLVFLLSFLQYCLLRVDAVRLLPIVALLTGSLIFALLASTAERRQCIAALGSPRLLAVIVLATLPALLSSLYRSNPYPLEYGLVMILTLFSARILLCGLGLEGLLRAFFYATAAGMVVVAGLTLPELLAAVGAQRYYPFFFEPNRIAFFAVTAIPAQLWMARRRRALLLLSALCGLVTVAASSRGSTGALLIGAILTVVLYGWKQAHRPWRMSRPLLATGLAGLLSATTLAAARPEALPAAGEYLWTKLDLGSRARGLDSGFTGRANGWTTLLDVLPKTSWLAGNGYRTSDEDFDFSVDSGYLASAYELGLFSTSVILLRYLAVLAALVAAYLATRSPGGLIFVVFTLAVFFANALVHRVLFGYGDPASLLALFCFVSSRHDAAAAWSPVLSTP